LKDRPFRPGAKGIEQVLGSLEAVIMEHLWKTGSQSIGELHETLGRKTSIAYTTVHTELARLVKKKLVVKRGRYAEATYAARVPRETFVNDLVRNVLRGLLDAHGPIAVHGFVDLIAEDDEARAALERRLQDDREKA
jgi:predicted transcriptional regulator